MSKIEYPFTIDEEAEFRFALVLESRSVEAHSLMDNGDNKIKIKDVIRHPILGIDSLQSELRSMIKDWKEKHKG